MLKDALRSLLTILNCLKWFEEYIFLWAGQASSLSVDCIVHTPAYTQAYLNYVISFVHMDMAIWIISNLNKKLLRMLLQNYTYTIPHYVGEYITTPQLNCTVIHKFCMAMSVSLNVYYSLSGCIVWRVGGHWVAVVGVSASIQPPFTCHLQCGSGWTSLWCCMNWYRHAVITCRVQGPSAKLWYGHC